MRNKQIRPEIRPEISKSFLTIFRNIQFFSCQGLAFRGNNNEGNYEYLMKLSAKVDPRITSWMDKKRENYLHDDTGLIKVLIPMRTLLEFAMLITLKQTLLVQL